jgi:hypothetical protein
MRAFDANRVAPACLQVEKYTSWDDLQRDYPHWNALLAKSSSRSIFLTWEWLQCWWRAFGNSADLLALICTDKNGALLGIAPLCRFMGKRFPRSRLKVLRLAGDGTDDSDNLDFICREGQELAVLKAVLDWLVQHPSEWDLLDLNNIPTESRTVMALRRTAPSLEYVARGQGPAEAA